MKSAVITGGAGFIGSNVTFALQERYPDAHLVVIDDFRSGHFKNLRGFRGDFLAADISRLDWEAHFKGLAIDTIFHLASITDTTIHDQFLQAHDNIEGFRRMMAFASGRRANIVYASSAATYGSGTVPMQEHQLPAPANIYAFSKVQLDNLARIYMRQNPDWPILGLRYFNVYGQREGHKKAAASMIYQLYLQMKAGRRPRVFRAGEHKRDFVYIKDVVAMTLLAAKAAKRGIYNCGSGQAVSFNEIIAILNEVLSTQLEPEYIENPHGDFYQAHTQADMESPKAALGFLPEWTPRLGIADYVTLLENGEPFDGAPEMRSQTRHGPAETVETQPATRLRREGALSTQSAYGRHG